MIPTTFSRRQPSYSCAVFLTTAACVLAFSLPGCVKSPREFLSSFRSQQADDEADAEESTAIADADEDDAELKAAIVSRSEKNPKLPQEEFGAENLLDRLLSRRNESPDGTTSDPFIDSDTSFAKSKQDSEEASRDTEPDVKRRAATLEELLAQSKPSSTRKSKSPDSALTMKGDSSTGVTPKSGSVNKNVFAPGFDSRLDQLKADLRRETDSIARKAADNDNPFAEFVAVNHTEKEPASAKDRGFVSSVSLERKADRNPGSDRPRQNALLPAKERVQALLAQAHEDWDSWRLEEAYRKTLAAQELSVLEGVEFDVSDERPADLAKRIASDIRKDTLASTSSKAESWTDEPASQDDAFGKTASQAFSSFMASTTPIGWQAAVPEASNGLPHIRANDPNAETDSSTNGRSGVSLLPPSSDDFPSDAEGIHWGNPSSTQLTETDHGHTSNQSIVNLAWPDETTSHSNKYTRSKVGGPELVRYDTESHDPTDHYSTEQGEDVLAHVAANRDRILQSEQPKWPAMPAPDTSEINHRAGRSEQQLAAAPPILLGVNDTPPSTSDVGVIDSSPQPPSAPLASVWYSRPLWFVGGLVLLMLSMRLLSRRSATHS